MPDDNQQTSQSSQQQAGQSGSADQAAQGGASNSNQATAGNQNQTTQTQQQAATKPDWATDAIWDKDKNEIKGDAVKELIARDAAEASRRLSLPAKPEDYKLALPKDFTPPQGVEFKLDENDPLFAQARTWAQKNGLTQEAFEQGIGMIAARDVATQQMLKTARDAEIGKLGANGTARVTAVNTFLDAKGLGSLKGMMVTAEIVTTLEKVVGMLNGADTFSQQHRTAPQTNGKIDGYEKMSFEQRRAAQDAQSARQTAAR